MDKKVLSIQAIMDLPGVGILARILKPLFRKIRKSYWKARDHYYLIFPFERKLRGLEDVLNLDKMDINGSEPTHEQTIHTWFVLKRQRNGLWPQSKNEEIFEFIKEQYPNEVLILDEEVTRTLRHEFSYYGMTFSRGEKIDWLLDPISGKFWPKQYFGIPYDVQGYGDLLYTRHLNMLLHLVPLAQMYGLKKEKTILLEIQNQIDEWVRSNPYKMTISWTSALEVAIRAIALLWVVQIVGFHALGAKTFGSILRLLYWHGKFLEENLSEDMESPNNHLIGESGALMVIGLAFPEFQEADNWVDRGWKVLEKQWEEQFHPFGAHREQAMGYHYFVVEIYTLVYLFSQKNKDLGPEFKSRLHAMYQYIFDSSQGNLPPTNWGDTSDLYFLPSLPDRELDHVKLMSLGSVLFQSEEFKTCVSLFSFSALWVLGIEGYHQFQQLSPRVPTSTSKGYMDSGVFIMRDGWSPEDRFMAIDCGELGLGYAGHGHADALSIEMSALGKKFIVDSGTYSYHAPGNWRKFFKGTSAHSTIVIDERDQAESRGSGPFGWVPFDKPKINHWWVHPKFDYFDGSLYGYPLNGKTLGHQRRVFFIKGEYWLISDCIQGEGRHKCQSFFHFPQGKVELNPKDLYVKTQYQESNLLLSYSGKNIQAEIIEGSENPIQGWISSGYGKKTSSPVLQLTQEQALPANVDVLLYPFSGPWRPEIKVRELLVRNDKGDRYAFGHCRGLSVGFFDYEDFFFFCNQNQNDEMKIAEDVVFDGHTLFLRIRQGQVVKGFMLGGSNCFVQNKTVPSSFIFAPQK